MLIVIPRCRSSGALSIMSNAVALWHCAQSALPSAFVSSECASWQSLRLNGEVPSFVPNEAAFHAAVARVSEVAALQLGEQVHSLFVFHALRHGGHPEVMGQVDHAAMLHGDGHPYSLVLHRQHRKDRAREPP